MASDGDEEKSHVQKELEAVITAPCFTKLSSIQWKKLFPDHRDLQAQTPYVYLTDYLVGMRRLNISSPICLFNFSADTAKAKFLNKLAKAYFGPVLTFTTKKTERKTLGAIVLVEQEGQVDEARDHYTHEANVVPVVVPSENDWLSIKKGIKEFVIAVCSNFLDIGVCVLYSCVFNPESREITLHPCPYCYEKLCHVLKFEPRVRETKLIEFYSEDNNFSSEANWEKSLLKAIDDKAGSESSSKRRRSEITRFGFDQGLDDSVDQVIGNKPKKKQRKVEGLNKTSVNQEESDASTQPSPLRKLRASTAKVSPSSANVPASSEKVIDNGLATMSASVSTSTSGSSKEKDTTTNIASPLVNDVEEISAVVPRPNAKDRMSSESNGNNDADNEQKWQNAVTVYMESMRRGSKVNNRNLQYCLVQYLATLKPGVDDDFNEKSIMADVKRHSMHLK